MSAPFTSPLHQPAPPRHALASFFLGSVRVLPASISAQHTLKEADLLGKAIGAPASIAAGCRICSVQILSRVRQQVHWLPCVLSGALPQIKKCAAYFHRAFHTEIHVHDTSQSEESRSILLRGQDD